MEAIDFVQYFQSYKNNVQAIIKEFKRSGVLIKITSCK